MGGMMFLARPFASIPCFFTVDGVLVGLVVVCIVFALLVRLQR